MGGRVLRQRVAMAREFFVAHFFFGESFLCAESHARDPAWARACRFQCT
jgi:hypothetical protein